MKDYKEPISKVQKRHQLRRLFGIMGGMIFAFAIFIGGVKVGIQIERERAHIAQEVASPMPGVKEKKGTDKNESTTPSPPPEKKDEKMQFTFYETLTRKEGVEKEQGKKEKTTATREKEKVAVKKEEAKAPSPPTTNVTEAKKQSVGKELYFVQIASFKEKEAAEVLKGRLVKKGYTVHVIPAEIEGMGLWYRVRLGGYKSLKEAHTAQKRISFEEGFTGTTVVSGK